MKIYIVADMEGITGIDDAKVWDYAHRTYAEGRRLMMGDVNAAVAGAFDAGATEVAVHDWHGGGNNLIMEDLDPRARHVRAAPGRWWGELDGSFDAVGFVGQHAMAGTLNGFLDHTMTGAWFELRFNGERVGEIALWATAAAMMKVPLAFLCGDRAACEEAAVLIPGIPTAAVKEGRGRKRASCLHPRAARERITAAVAEGVRRRGELPRVGFKPPVRVELVYTSSDRADEVAWRRGIERIDARTVRWEASTPEDLLMV